MIANVGLPLWDLCPLPRRTLTSQGEAKTPDKISIKRENIM